MKKLLLLLMFVCSQALAGPSTINTGIPSQGQPYNSGPLSGNFAAAANDINGIISMNNGSTAPLFPVLGQIWLNTTHSPYVEYVWDGGAWAFVCNLDPVGHTCIGVAATGSGTVTSIAETVPTEFTISGSPITTSGTLSITKAAQSANTIWAGPVTGASAQPAFRALVGADLPAPSASSPGGVESIVALSNNWISYIDTSGVPHQSQPAFANLSGSATCSQLPALTGDSTTSAGSCVTTVDSVNGVTYPASPSINTVPVVTSSGVVAYEAVPNAALANPSLTVAGHAISLGGTQAIACGDLSNGSTGCSSATGTSGHVIPYLDGANIFSAMNVFNIGDFGLQGSSTGVTIISSANAGGSNYTATLPAATDTIVELTQTQTLTNKSIDASEITSGIFSTSRIPTSSNMAWTGEQSFQGSSSNEAANLTNAAEAIDIVGSAPTSTQNIYIASGAIQDYTSYTANNWTINWAWSSGTTMNTAMAVGDSITTVMIVINSSSAYYASAFTIDGASVTPKWLGGTAPSAGDTNALDIYTCTIIKTASATYTVLCTMNQFK